MTARGAPREPYPVLVITGEMRGWIEPCGCTEGMLGGLARRAALVERLRATGRLPHLLDLGDLMLEPGRQTELKLDAVARAYRSMGVAAIAVGELDLQLGLEGVAAIAERAGAALVGSNLVLAAPPGGGAAPGALPPAEVRASADVDTALGPLRVEAYLSPAFAADVEVLSGGALRLASPPEAAPAAPVAPEGAAPPAAPAAGARRTVILYHGPLAEAAERFGARADVLLVAAGHGVELPEPARRLPGGALLVSVGDKGKVAAVVRIERADGDGAGGDGAGAPAAGALRAEIEEMAALSDLVPDEHAVAAIYAEYRQRLYEENLLEGMDAHALPVTGGQIVGAERCAPCHPSAFGVFERMRHAHAFDSLVPRNATRDPECLRCHTTGFGYASGFAGIERTPHLAHVGCESCHGAGSHHADAPRAGFGRIPAPEQLCTTCHDAANSPRFDFSSYWEKIRHGRER